MRRVGVWLSLAGALVLAAPAARAQNDAAPPEHEFYFTRGIYSGPVDGDAWGPRWRLDYPDSDRHYLVALQRMTAIDADPEPHPVAIGDPRLRDYPFVYLVEVGGLVFTDEEVVALREYLLAGGFMVVDDFWGTAAWRIFAAQMRRVFPDRPIVEVPLDHPIFHCFYDISALVQVPNVAQGSGPKTWEFDGYVPHARGIFDDQGRLMVLINWNTDLGDAWEWADDPAYALRYSTFAFEMGVNFAVYAMDY